MSRGSTTFPSAEPGPQSSVILKCGSDIQMQPIEWLWPGYLPRGKFSLLAGQPGAGKTTIAMAMAGATTSTRGFPDGTFCAPGNVLIWSGEDDPADTLLPRLIAAGAERSRCYFVDGTQVDGQVVPFDPATDMAQLQQAIEEIGGVDLIIVDPVVSAVSGDSHKNTEVRRSLQPLVDLAADTRAAILGISHFSKSGQGGDPTQRVIGSVAFTAVARVVLVAAKAKGEDGADVRILARSKSNIGKDGSGFEYTLEQTEVQQGIEASHVVWGKAVDGEARELLNDPDQDDDAREEASDAVDALRQCLTGPGWFPASATQKAMKDAGFSPKQIRSAGKKLNLSRRKGAMNDGWYWRIPGGNEDAKSTEGALEDAQDALLKNTAPSASSGHLRSIGGLQ
ncbi:MAG: AAA family ATPase [Proteobacteria bacterium]|nr:MAG: AAA family ATPase [Pseudomonadota bacterium]